MFLWNRNTGAVHATVHMSDDPAIQDRETYPSSGGAAWRRSKEARGFKALAFLLVDFNTLVVRDGIPVQDAHREFLKVKEYREFISPDCEGAA